MGNGFKIREETEGFLIAGTEDFVCLICKELNTPCHSLIGNSSTTGGGTMMSRYSGDVCYLFVAQQTS